MAAMPSAKGIWENIVATVVVLLVADTLTRVSAESLESPKRGT